MKNGEKINEFCKNCRKLLVGFQLMLWGPGRPMAVNITSLSRKHVEQGGFLFESCEGEIFGKSPTKSRVKTTISAHNLSTKNTIAKNMKIDCFLAPL
jgi:hypothetical protein